MNTSTKVVLVAVAAGALGVVASLLTSGPGPLWKTEVGQRALNSAMQATAPPAYAAAPGFNAASCRRARAVARSSR